jgi:arsenate reductase (thioredoxin)
VDTRTPLDILFLCTGNSARSIFGELLLRDLAPQRFRVASAGSHPTGRVHPMARRVLREVYGIDSSGARSKSIEDLGDASFDLVVTVCDDAKESCPLWPRQTALAHWGLPDPAAVSGPEEEVLAAFRATAAQLRQRLKKLCSLPLEEMDREQLEGRARGIAEGARKASGATP